ncbi:MAG: hypothetical protein GX596_00255 [Propionibacterium sp.]|nr:hypothetical protein [Propionibacterium sp.]
MAVYSYITFDGTTLPTDDISQDLGTDDSLLQLVDLPNAPPYDAGGDEVATALPRIVQAHCRIVGASASDVQTTWDGLRAKRGVRGTLTLGLAGGGTRTREARLKQISAMRYGGHPIEQPVNLVFQLLGECWQGADHDDEITLGVGIVSANITNAGNIVCRDVTVTVTAQTSAITALVIENRTAGHISKIQYTGSIAAGESLVIDCAQWTVENDGTGDYEHLSRRSGHAVTEWLRLAPGVNTIYVTRTGGGATSTCKLEFHDAYA